MYMYVAKTVLQYALYIVPLLQGYPFYYEKVALLGEGSSWGDYLVVYQYYYYDTSQFWPDKRDDIWWEWPYKTR